MAIRKVVGQLILVVSIAGPMAVQARADMIGTSLSWQYYGGGGPWDPGTPGTETSGTFVDDGGVEGTFIEPTEAGPLPVFNIDADDTTITFDYSVDEATGPWSASPLSLSPTIFNGVAINLESPGSFGTVSIDPVTNIAGFGASNFSFTGNQIEVDWENLEFSPSTIVRLDVTMAAPEPTTWKLMFASIFGIALVCRSRIKFS
ncbi:MAG TPA: hypothetical protein VGL82_16810 [Bryobacteraceae bacterium]